MRARTIILAFLVCLYGSTAAAQTAETATSLVDHGLNEREAGHDAQALDLFLRAYAIDPAPRTLAQIALAEQAMGQWLPAFRDISAALNNTTDSWISSRRRVLTQARQELAPHIGYVKVSAARAGLHVFVNGDDCGALPLVNPIPAETGRAEIELRDGNEVLARAAGSVVAQQTLELVIDVAPGVSTVANPPEIRAVAEPTVDTPANIVVDDSNLHHAARIPTEESHPTSTRHVLAYTALGVAGAALVAGVVLHVVQQNAVSTANKDCSDANCMDPMHGPPTTDYINASKTAQSLIAPTFASYLTAGVLGATGLGLLIIHPSAESPNTSLACNPSLGAVGVVCAGTF